MIDALWNAALPPFSFTFAGQPSADLLPRWTADETTSADGISRRTYRDPATGLRIVATIRRFAEAGAVEWVLEIANDGAADTPLLADILPLDVTLPRAKDVPVQLHHANGSLCEMDDFIPRTTSLRPGAKVKLAPFGGRSSNGVMPFMNVQLGPDEGVVLAIGWSGQWAAWFDRDEAGVRVRAGMERTSLALRPGETIRSPRILLVPWKGDDPIVGNNLLRRTILAHYTPTLDGEPILPPIAHMRQLKYYFTGQVTEADHLEAIAKAHDLGFEAFWVDALWYGGGDAGGVDWASQVGNWTVRKDRFPRGLKPIADAAHEAGMKFVLWLEPERVVAGTAIAREHPDYVLRVAGDEFSFLLDLGNPAARAHITDLVSKLIDEVGIDIYRQDFNMEPLPYWRAADEPDRIGMHEIRHVEGLYALWDELKRRHPRLAIDNCASGGRRIDLETTARAFPLWRSDYTDVGALHEGMGLQVGAQSQVAGLSRWVPLHTAAVWTFSPYDFRSSMSAGVIPYTDILAPDYPSDDVRRAVRELKRLRPFVLGDFHPLVPPTVAYHDWCAYQYDRPDMGAGCAVFLRRHESPFPTMEARLHGIDPAATYDVSISPTFDEAPRRRMSGADLARMAVTILDRPGSVLVEYHRAT